MSGGWPDIWRANMCLRGAGRVLVRVASFRAMHLAQLDKRARKVDWGAFLRPDVAIKVDATCRASKIYHNKAAAQRVARAISEGLGAPVAPKAALRVMVRIEDDLCTISLDTSGAPLHQRGLKQAVGKAPLRETLAALFLRQCGFDGTQPVFDPMCGSGTFVIEAAEIAAGLQAGRDRPFAFEQLAGFDDGAAAGLRSDARRRSPQVRLTGSDRDRGVIEMAEANAVMLQIQQLNATPSVASGVPEEVAATAVATANEEDGQGAGDMEPVLPVCMRAVKSPHHPFNTMDCLV